MDYLAKDYKDVTNPIEQTTSPNSKSNPSPYNPIIFMMIII